MTTGERIKKRRIKLGMSADKLAEQIGVSRSTMFRYESGTIEKMPINNLVPIARALNTTVGYLMGWDEDESKQCGSVCDTDGASLNEKHEKEAAVDNGSPDEVSMKIAEIILRLSPAQKAEALHYLQYLESKSEI